MKQSLDDTFKRSVYGFRKLGSLSPDAASVPKRSKQQRCLDQEVEDGAVMQVQGASKGRSRSNLIAMLGGPCLV